MSKVVIQGNISGTGTVTLAAPNTNSNVTIDLPVTGGQMIAATPGTAGNVLTSTGSAWTSQAAAAFDSGTLMLFQQTNAPTGWTKQTTHNDKALRVVSGTASSGGSVGFTTAFASGLSAGATTLTTAQMPSHNHQGYAVFSGSQSFSNYSVVASATEASIQAASGTGTTSAGSSNSHDHSLPSFAVSYVDLIIAAKN